MEEIEKTTGWNETERFLLKATGAVAFALLTILSAQIRIPLPFTPVPMTLQTFVVPVAGGILGMAWGGFSMLLYLALGFLGLDVFAAASAGISFFLAPTAGYLLSYPVVAMLVGKVRSITKSSTVLLGVLILSHILIFTFGVTGLMLNAGMTLSDAIARGVLPFLAGDMIKIAASFLVLLSFDLFRKRTDL